MTDYKAHTLARLSRRDTEVAPWMVPIANAVAQGGARLDVVTPEMTVFGKPAANDRAGVITFVGDDLDETIGPEGFPALTAAMVKGAVSTANTVILVACAPLRRFYSQAALTALAGDRVVLIEARQSTQDRWLKYIHTHAKAGAKVALGLVPPGAGDGEPVTRTFDVV